MESFESQVLRYETEQQKYWEALKSELEGLKNQCGASVAELAEGLDISKQTLYNFTRTPSKGISNFHRGKLLRLWAYLTDTEQSNQRKLAPKHKAARDVLRRRGPNHLLSAAGFAPESEINDKSINVSDPQMKRLILRLSSNWMFDETLRAYIIDGFLDNVLDQGRPDKSFYLKQLNYKSLKDRMEILEWPFNFKLQENPTYQSDSIKKSYKNAIKNLVSAGKTNFMKSELFELYQSIIEHYEVNTANSHISIHSCEFETLSSISILEQIGIPEIHLRAEKRVAFNPDTITSNDPLPTIIKVKIGCKFNFSKELQEYSKEISYFNYASTATHVENMLVAIKDALCHSLTLSGFFVKAVGRTSKSLARVSITLAENASLESEEVNDVYQGWWVSSNTILGILNAFADACKRWMSKNYIDSNDYYRTCQKLSEINQIFYKINSSVYEGGLPSTHDSHLEERPIRDEIEISVEEMKNIIENLGPPKSPPYLDGIKFRIRAKERRSQLTLLHLAIHRGEIKKAKEIISRNHNPRKLLGNKITDPQNKHFRNLLAASASVSYMKYKLVTGNEELLKGKLWRKPGIYSLKKGEDIARDYVSKTGNINFNCYFFMSDLLGIHGLLEFYAGGDSKRHLEEGFNYLLEAAHYSSRIGYQRRAAQWLMYALRCLLRLSVEDVKRQGNLMLARTKDILDSNQFAHDKDWLNSIYHLSRGEYLLFVDNNEHKAKSLVEFLIALRCSIDIGYMRLVPDCLYDIARACQAILTHPKKEELEQEALSLIQSKGIYHDFGSGDQIGFHVIERMIADSQTLNLDDVIKTAKEEAIFLWNNWAKEEGYENHVFSENIKKGDFLAPILQD
jgi:hypothetical protein